jgi:hypothetical protein
MGEELTIIDPTWADKGISSRKLTVWELEAS